MKNNKVLIAILAAVAAVAAVVGVLALAGFFKLTPMRLAKRSLKELAKVQSFDSDITIEYEGTIDFMGSDVEFTLNADCDFKGVTKTGTGYVSGKLGTKLPIVGELSIPVEGYQQYQDDGMLTYTRFNQSEWLRSKVVPLQTSAEGIQFNLDYKVVLGILQKIAAGEIKTELAQETETLHGQEVYRMDIAIAGDLLNQILLTVSKAQGENSAVPDNFDISDGDAAIVLYIYKESKLPAKLVIDCTALGRAVIRNLLKNSNTGDSISTGTSRFVITITLIRRFFTHKVCAEAPQTLRIAAARPAGLEDRFRRYSRLCPFFIRRQITAANRVLRSPGLKGRREA